ncbi:MAG: ATP-binding protein [Marinoscillum sp.]
MIFRRSLFWILLRVIILTGFIFSSIFVYLRTDLNITPIMFGMLAMVSLIELIWYLRSQEREWLKFLDAIEHDDFNRVFTKQAHSRELQAAFSLITRQMEKLSTEKQAEDRLLKTVLGHISIALVCYKEDGQILFANKSFRSLFGIKGLVHLEKLQAKFPEVYQLIKGADDAMDELIKHPDDKQLHVRLQQFKMQQEAYKLVSFADIKKSLDTKEIESYENLMRVMTHEIMNSATPILSLVQVINAKLIDNKHFTIPAREDRPNLVKSLQAIEKRTDGMLKFVEGYKQIGQPIQPQLGAVNSTEFVEKIVAIVPADIDIEINDTYNGPLMIDQPLMSQVLLNLLKNAVYATKEIKEPHISISISYVSPEIHMTIGDNGPGVALKDINHIFIPFFTTKKEGSGIGLSLSRKIVKAHGGHLVYHRIDGMTQFIVKLPMNHLESK